MEKELEKSWRKMSDARARADDERDQGKRIAKEEEEEVVEEEEEEEVGGGEGCFNT